MRIEAQSGPLPRKPFLIRRSVEDHLKVRINDANPERRGDSYVMRIRNPKHVDQLKTMKKLSDGFPIRIIDHPTLNLSKCVITCHETLEYSEEELTEELKDQGVTTVKKIFRREDSEIKPTPTVILTIKGTVIPDVINIGWIKTRTRPYYPSPLICYGCYCYGHPKIRCTAKQPVCGNCSGKHAIDSANPCTRPKLCKNCTSTSHAVNSRACPIYTMEAEIQRIRIDENISYGQARRRYEAQRRQTSYATITTVPSSNRTNIPDNKLERILTEIETLRANLVSKDKQMAEKDAKIGELEAMLTAKNRKNTEISTLDTPSGSKDSAAKTLELPRGTPNGSRIRKRSRKKHSAGTEQAKNSNEEMQDTETEDCKMDEDIEREEDQGKSAETSDETLDESDSKDDTSENEDAEDPLAKRIQEAKRVLMMKHKVTEDVFIRMLKRNNNKYQDEFINGKLFSEKCQHCPLPCSWDHLFLDCPAHEETRIRWGISKDMTGIFQTKMETMIANYCFVSEINQQPVIAPELVSQKTRNKLQVNSTTSKS